MVGCELEMDGSGSPEDLAEGRRFTGIGRGDVGIGVEWIEEGEDEDEDEKDDEEDGGGGRVSGIGSNLLLA